ncbi:HNH endonuclease [Bradyrhizobium sp. 6(2017)]|uniref:HNH endonuclease n=1 Tax=Bradyrhizobium sp. 6(2017) TaxID=1197460 RepID=UPI00197A85A3|nr:HNH endonuclease [Bradyrhizobium sp. 6(2017)]
MSDPYYKTAHWRRLRKARLMVDGFTCVVRGCGQPAKVVDHIITRRKGGPDTVENTRSLCDWHDRQIKEMGDGRRRNGGRLVVKGCFADGTPRDPNHPWHTGGK